jgi:hypothetical protein
MARSGYRSLDVSAAEEIRVTIEVHGQETARTSAIIARRYFCSSYGAISVSRL